MFADDIILIAKASTQQSNMIKSTLDMLCKCSGQKVNFSKSKVMFSSNVNDNLSSQISSVLNFDIANDLIGYLGVPIISGRKGKEAYAFFIDKVGANSRDGKLNPCPLLEVSPWLRAAL